MSIKEKLDVFVKWRNANRPSISTATLAVTEKYVRRKLKLKKDEPLHYAGLNLVCIGSKRWRNEHHYQEGVVKAMMNERR